MQNNENEKVRNKTMVERMFLVTSLGKIIVTLTFSPTSKFGTAVAVFG